MCPKSQDAEPAALQKKVKALEKRISHYELAAQRTREVQSKLDMQIDLFTRIHQCSQRAFQTKTPEELASTIVEGIVDIFQVEIGALFSLVPSGDRLELLGQCNLDACGLVLHLPQDWLGRQELWDFKKHKALWESPVPENSPWACLELIHALYMPLFNNDRQLEGILLGGISIHNQDFYDFFPNELLSSFMVFTQQMNGIYNNFSALRLAHEADKAKSSFMANLSHEMRTPMNAIIGMVQVSKRSNNIDRLKKEMGQIEIASQHLLSLINDVLDISKIEEGKFVLDSTSFNLEALIGSMLSSIRQNAVNKHQNLVIDYHGVSAFDLIGDPVHLSQVLINLLSNAVKFTPEYGNIRLDIEEVARDTEKVLLKFSVTDTGIGIPAEFIDRLFCPFEQADSSISRRYGGTGLGLAICQRIVELMGGSLEVSSEEGKGTCFSFSCWFCPDLSEPVCPGTSEECEAPDYSGLRGLIVDDVDINRDIVISLLEDTGMVFEEARDGKEGVDMVAASAPGYFDLILMDVQMPVMDGYTAARKIRSLDRQDASTISIVAMTANVFKEDVQAALDAGMDGHIGKPLEYRQLINNIARAFEKKKCGRNLNRKPSD